MNKPLSFAQLAGQFQKVNVGTLLFLRKTKVNKAGTSPIYLRIYIGADRIHHSCSIRVTPEQWDAPNGRILGKGKLVQQQNEQLQLLKSHVPELVNLMKATGRKITISSLRRELIAPAVGKSPCFMAVCQQASESRDRDSPAARLRIQYALGAMADWRGRDKRTSEPHPLPLEDFTPKLAAEFYRWLLQVRGLKASSANVIINSLVGVFRYAAETGEVEANDNPFRALRKQKAAPAPDRLRLTLAQLATLRAAELPTYEALSRDVYLAQYYLHGSRIGAVLKLRWQDVGADVVRLKVEKGGPQKEIALSEPLRQILARYHSATSLPCEPVFPLLPATFFSLSADARHRAGRSATGRVNHGLARLAKLLGIAGHLHTHTARHTLAAHAAQVGGLETAQGMLGHATAAMTARYAGPQRSPGLDLAEQVLYSGGVEPSSEPPAIEGNKVVPMWKGGLVA